MSLSVLSVTFHTMNTAIAFPFFSLTPGPPCPLGDEFGVGPRNPLRELSALLTVEH